MNVLIDTNVLLSAALRDRLPERVVLYVATHADFLITGDKDLLQVKSLVTTRIVKVAEFARLFGIS